MAESAIVQGTRILVGATQMLLQTGMGLGLDRAALLSEAGLSEPDLADRDAYLPFARQVALGEAIIAARPGVNIGMAALRHVSPSDFGVLGYVITHSATLREALDGFVRFQRLLTDGVRWQVELGSDCAITVNADPAYARLGHPIEALVGLWIVIGRMLTGVAWSPLSVRFQHAPLGDPQEVEQNLGASVTFRAAKNEVRLALETLQLPVTAGRAALMPSLAQLAEARLAQIDGFGTTTAQLRALMFERIPRGVTARSELARILGMSERTLNRRLHEEGTTFRDVLDGVRHELALAWLSDARHAVYEVAFLLGYSEPSTFYRSFRRWTGESPKEWRRARIG